MTYAWRTLTTAEKKYCQLEKEALAIIFGIKKLHLYISGRNCSLITDHKPLQTILGPKSGIPSITAARLQRWALTLSAYLHSLVYRQSNDNVEAEGFHSRVRKTTVPDAARFASRMPKVQHEDRSAHVAGLRAR